MAQLNITLNEEEILQLLSTNHDLAFRELLRNSLNSILMAESAAQLKAEPYERSEERTDSRNGIRERDLKTRIGKITLAVRDIGTFRSRRLYSRTTPVAKLL